LTGTADGPAGSVVEDRVSARFTLGPDAVPAVGLWDFASGETREEVEVIGDRATLRISMFSLGAAEVIDRDGSREILAAPAPAVVQEPLIAAVVASLAGGGPAISTGETAVRTARVVDTLLADHRRRHGIHFG